MELQLVRDTYTRLSTTGRLSIDGHFFCYTLEDVVRPVKIPKETAIPVGRFRIELTQSGRFGSQMPLLQDVPGFTSILIHWGNWAKDTEGCILLGTGRTDDFVSNSRAAFKAFQPLLIAASNRGEAIWISISESGRPEQAAPSFDAGTRVRVVSETAAITARGNEPLLAVQGSELEVTAKSRPDAAVRVTGVDADGDVVAGLVAASAVEAVPLDAKGRSNASTEWRVNASTLFLRNKAGASDDDSVLASLPRGQLLRKLAVSSVLPWWKVRAIIATTERDGFVHSGFLRAATEIPVVLGRPASEADRIQLSDRALGLIVKAEGMDQPSKWPGHKSGVTIGIGYDLGYVTTDRFRGDWGQHLSAAHLDSLSTAIGLSGEAARIAARQFVSITITRKAAEEVFQRCSVPRMCGGAARAFPGILSLPADAQGALVSLVFNRGTDMGHPNPAGQPKDRRAEMRDIRAAVASSTLEMDAKLRKISAALRAMCRIWEGKGVDGLIRRRNDEAALVDSCLL